MSWLDTLKEIRETDWNKVSVDEREAKAREVVTICAYASAALSVVPFSDLVILVPVHTVMVMTVGRIHDRKLSGAEAKRVVIELGAIAGVTFAGKAAINALSKILLPGYGSVVAVPATFALTWALGRVAIEYFADPALSREDLKKLFDEAMKEGKATFSKEAFERFRQKNQDVKAEDVEGETASEPEPRSTQKPAAEKPATEKPPTEPRPPEKKPEPKVEAKKPEPKVEVKKPEPRTKPDEEASDRAKTDPIPKKKRTL